MTQVRLAVDAMGGDHGPQTVVPAIETAISRDRELHISCVGDIATIRKATSLPEEHPQLKLVHAEQVVSMDDKPLQALRRKRRNSSMGVALRLLRDGEADACISAGNTGALTAMACHMLKTIPGVERPALCTAIPNINAPVLLLDLGANTEVTEKQMTQFAVMGTSLATVIYGTTAPPVALLNIGTETHKGTDYLKNCDTMLRASKMNYQGYAEANEIFSGKYRVIVCDGYTGNMVLKSAEGAIQLIGHYIKAMGKTSILHKLALGLAMPMLWSLNKKIDYRKYNGASLLGLQGVVVKSHGHADSEAFYRALKYGATAVRKKLLQQITGQLDDAFREQQA